MIKIKQILIVISIFSINILTAQNLVIDGCFDSFKKKIKYWEPQNLKYWYNPTKASPDLFTKYNKNPKFRDLKNKDGTQRAFCKEAYVGIAIYDINLDYREYIGTRLKDSLKKDSLYCISMFISLADKAKYATNAIGFLLTKEKIKYQYMTVLPYNSTKKRISKVVINDMEIWVEIKTWFRAKGGEQYLIIGNFENDKNTKLITIKKNRRSRDNFSYYYIDNISLYPINDTTECRCYKDEIVENKGIAKDSSQNIFNSEKIKQGESIVLKNVYFKINKSDLLPNSFAELNKLADYLKSNPAVKIEISGHTDNTGMETKNKELSKARAKSVYNYLLSKGVKKENIIYIGYGSSKPIADNSTEEGRSVNRRVEIKIL